MRWALALALVGCAPVLDDRTPLVEAPRVLAVRTEPPEVRPGEPVRVEALAADATGELAEAPVAWSFCLAPKPLAELGPIAPTCLDPDSADLAPIGMGRRADGLVPQEACSLFGPDPPPSAEGEAGRPTDPDATGGYYQPIVGLADDWADPTLAAVRLRCGLPDVRQEAYIAWNQRYVSNTNPRVASVAVQHDGGFEPVAGDAPAPRVHVGADVTLVVTWSPCEPEVPCDGAETYVVYDRATDALVPRREAISATWFATGGALRLPRNGRAGDDDSPWIANGWTAPEEPGEVWLAVVLRDERGGVGFAGFRVEVADP